MPAKDSKDIAEQSARIYAAGAALTNPKTRPTSAALTEYSNLMGKLARDCWDVSTGLGPDSY